MAPVTALLAALEKDDAAAVRAVTVPEGLATAVRAQSGGTATRRTVRWSEFAADLKPGTSHFTETLGQPAIEIDDAIAMAWAPYTVTIAGKVAQCGYEHFDLVRVGDRWTILNLTWFERNEGCAAQ